MEPTTKQIQITGLHKKKRGGSRKNKNQQQQVPVEAQQEQELEQQPTKNNQVYLVQKIGGSCGVPGYQNPIQVSSASPLSLAFKLPAEAVDRAVPVAGPPLPIGGPGQASMQGGAKIIKLHKKNETSKVKLHSKKPDVHKSGHKTKKNRRIILGLESLKKRQTKASKIKQTVKEMPLEELKKQLIQKGLIKATSKAPESILRQIAADSQIVGSGSC
jgi:hypothetical protein